MWMNERARAQEMVSGLGRRSCSTQGPSGDHSEAADPNSTSQGGLGWSQPSSPASTRLDWTNTDETRAFWMLPGGFQSSQRPWDSNMAQWTLVVLSNSIKNSVKTFKMCLWASSFLRGEKEASPEESQTSGKTPVDPKALRKNLT